MAAVVSGWVTLLDLISACIQISADGKRSETGIAPSRMNDTMFRARSFRSVFGGMVLLRGNQRVLHPSHVYLTWRVKEQL
jgi:hypothetical protein